MISNVKLAHPGVWATGRLIQATSSRGDMPLDVAKLSNQHDSSCHFVKILSFVATIVQSSLQAANLILRQATESASKVLRETIQLNTMISDITFKFNQIVFLVGNASSMISNASATGNDRK